MTAFISLKTWCGWTGSQCREDLTRRDTPTSTAWVLQFEGIRVIFGRKTEREMFGLGMSGTLASADRSYSWNFVIEFDIDISKELRNKELVWLVKMAYDEMVINLSLSGNQNAECEDSNCNRSSGLLGQIHQRGRQPYRKKRNYSLLPSSFGRSFTFLHHYSIPRPRQMIISIDMQRG